jgi:hypothetical protein
VKAEWVATEGPLHSAVLYLAGTEYALRYDDAKKTAEAHDLFGKARDDLRAAQGPARNMVAAELAFAVLAFGGTEEQAKEQVRIRWQPGTGSGTQPRMNERVRTVHGELTTVLGLLAATDYELKISVARRLTRELTKCGHASLAADLIPLALFTEPQKNEARAVIALEIYRTDPGSDVPSKIANDLKTQFSGAVGGDPFPASAHALFAVLNVDKPPRVVGPLPAAGDVSSDGLRFAHTTLLLMEGKPDEALKLAVRPRGPESQLKALVLCAEWTPDPGPALEAAQGIVATTKGRKDVAPSPYHVVRLAQIAAEKGRHDLAKTFAESLADEGLRAWAKGDAARLRIAATPQGKAEDSWVELPDAAPLMKAGHAWGRLWVARQNAKLSHNRDEEKKATASWPQPVHPFALAGIALGLQDK